MKKCTHESLQLYFQYEKKKILTGGIILVGMVLSQISVADQCVDWTAEKAVGSSRQQQ